MRKVKLGLGRMLAWCVLSAMLVTTSAALAVAQGAGTHTTATASAKWRANIQLARTLVDSLIRANRMPGVSIAVSVGKEIVWSEGFGYASIEQKSPVTATTKFRIGSIAKPLTAALLARLYERGSLDLDAPIQKYVPSFPVNAKGQITTRMLATHMAGIRHYRGNENDSYKHYATVLEGLDIFKNDTLEFVPGTRMGYSSYGYNLLSAVLEGAGKNNFLALMSDSIFRPLGMRNTEADHVDSIILGRTGYYERTQDGKIVNARAVDNSYKWGSGGFLSTPEDVLRFAHAHMFGNFFKPATVALLWTSAKTPDGKDTGYGLGWEVEKHENKRMVSHYGSSVGGSSVLLVFPDDGIAIMMTSNMSGADFGQVPHRIALSFAKKDGR